MALARDEAMYIFYIYLLGIPDSATDLLVDEIPNIKIKE